MRDTAHRTVYVNGHFIPETQATVSVFDRGFLFADGVYEVTCVLDGRLVDFPGHMARLRRSLDELGMRLAITDPELGSIHQALIQRNAVVEGLVYLQVTRGEADRNFTYPDATTPPTLVLFTQAKQLLDNPASRDGLKVISLPDLRWGRRDIKTIQLLYASMAKTQAIAQGADDAWLVENGQVNEGSSSNALIVAQDGTLLTKPLSRSILHGITRASVMTMAQQDGIQVEERGFTISEAQQAREAFITSSTAFVHSVIEIDGKQVGDGRPGPVAKRLRSIYIEEARSRTT